MCGAGCRISDCGEQLPLYFQNQILNTELDQRGLGRFIKYLVSRNKNQDRLNIYSAFNLVLVPLGIIKLPNNHLFTYENF
jgi:hypothetical protein